VAELVFFSGTMDCGKSTLALQTDHNHASRGRAGLVFTQMDRAGEAVLSSRLGLKVAAYEVTEDLDLHRAVADRLAAGQRIDYLICDEAQFYTMEQIDQLADVVDDLGLDVYAFGITTDFRTKLFPGSARLIELADRVEVLQVASLCWCGSRGTHQARTVDGVVVREGVQVVVGDVDGGRVAYEVLCRAHHRRGMTSSVAEREHQSPDPLPFDLEPTQASD
jgi:thymidine kinase